MPKQSRHTGINSMSELFAMKKNMASQVWYDHNMSSLTKDYYYRKERLNHEIDQTYRDMKDIQLSTGYTLGKPKSAERKGPPVRRVNAPKVYFPPIGVRLVKKYVGVDIKRRSSLMDAFGSIPHFYNQSTPISTKGDKERSPLPMKSLLEDQEGIPGPGQTGTICPPINLPEEQRGSHVNTTAAVHADKHSKQDQVKIEITECLVSRQTRLLDETTAKQTSEERELVKNNPLFNLTRESDIQFYVHPPEETEKEKHEEHDTEEQGQGISKIGTDGKQCEDPVFLDTTYNLEERRSSRSTFRARSSVRPPSQSQHLQQHNKEVVSHVSKTSNRPTTLRTNSTLLREKVGSFSLDYGDGKLHDIMEIPKVKDCWRPWCNPHCKTCQNRTTGKPCFVLVPVNKNAPMRKTLINNRKPAMGPMYKTIVTNEDQKDGDDVQETSTEKEMKTPNETPAGNDDDSVENIQENYENNNEKDEAENEIEEILKAAKIKQRKKGYSKKRIDELSQPRGGPPPEVRFSKWSLRKKQGQLVEDERQKELEERERENLTMIQGKITVFLAMLNQHELKTTPANMVDIPIRENITVTTKPKQMRSRRGKRNVRFHLKQRSRLPS